MDAMRTARALIARRAADPKAKFFGFDKDLEVLRAALDQLVGDQQFIAATMARLCTLVSASTHSEPTLRMLHEWETRLIEIAGDRWE